MGVSYDLFTAAFLNKVTEYNFIMLEDNDKINVVDGYMKRACAQFNHICKYDISTGDDEAREFPIEVPDDEVDEIVDIVSEGMLVQWMKPYFYHADNLINAINTRDFTQYSPAELLYRITNAYNTSKRDFKNMMREYSYNHGDLGNLAL